MPSGVREGDETDLLERGRESFHRQAWDAAYTTLAQVDRSFSLHAEDVERSAIAAYLLGKDADSEDLWARAHRQYLAADNPAGAARCAFWLALGLVLRGEMARGGGWFVRAQQVLDDRRLDCVEVGYLRIPAGLHSMAGGDHAGALARFGEAAQAARRFGDPDLQALARLGEGQTRLRLGQTAEGVALLDQAMVAVEAREVAPISAGIIYCAVILECHAIFDLRRAREWTSALDRWCASQPDLVPYRGQCLVHRSQIMQLRGAWSDALEEARRARVRLADPPVPAMGMALLQLAELHRLRGELTEADAAYLEAVQSGSDPQPGLALLRLAQGQAGVAEAGIRRALEEARDPPVRARLLPAYAQIMLANNAVAAARAAADELLEIARHFEVPFLRAVAAQANGAVLLAEGQARAALEVLREAWRAWEQVDAPYHIARTRVLVGVALAQLDDRDTGSMEWEAARVVFQAVGAEPDLAALDAATGREPSAARGLTSRELEVLRLVASGGTNKAIAETLFLSERTVDRHVSNLFAQARRVLAHRGNCLRLRARSGVTSRVGGTTHTRAHPRMRDLPDAPSVPRVVPSVSRLPLPERARRPEEADMAIAMLVDNPDGSQELYEKVRARLGLDGPAGGIVHIAGPAPTGGWRVIKVWESVDQASEFLTQRFAPALRAVGYEGQAPQPQFWPVDAYLTGAGI